MDKIACFEMPKLCKHDARILFLHYVEYGRKQIYKIGKMYMLLRSVSIFVTLARVKVEVGIIIHYH